MKKTALSRPAIYRNMN
ncbi:hypothetical protein [Vibrio anguillarum]